MEHLVESRKKAKDKEPKLTREGLVAKFGSEVVIAAENHYLSNHRNHNFWEELDNQDIMDYINFAVGQINRRDKN
jgi:hypothetical protein